MSVVPQSDFIDLVGIYNVIHTRLALSENAFDVFGKYLKLLDPRGLHSVDSEPHLNRRTDRFAAISQLR